MLKPRWIDVSVGLRSGMPHWPGNPPVKIVRTQDMARGGHSNVSALSFGTHTGTHIDAPAHFLKGGAGADRVPFEATNGAARVIGIRGRETIDSKELIRHRLRRGVRTVGVDYLSVGGFRKNGGEIHRVLLKAGITIIEGLDLSAVRPGRFDLACLALKITGGDGAPARAMLRAA